MQFATINPATEELLRQYVMTPPERVEEILEKASSAQRAWRDTPVGERAEVIGKVAEVLRNRTRELAELISMEMGKPLRESVAEVEKCALAMDYYAQHGAAFLADETMEFGPAKNFVTFQPLGIVLAVMPWNFPVWQVLRFAAPALIAGNAGILKHAPNVPGCALATVDLFDRAGLPAGLFETVFIDTDATRALIADPRIQAVTLTGSTRAGQAVAAEAGREIKTCVLELGGSDPYVVLEDADLARTVEACVTSRLINSGQSCIAAKRLIVHEDVADEFTERVVARMQAVRVGDPFAEHTDVGPLAREDLRDNLHRQVQESVAAGATCLLGGQVPKAEGWYYSPTVLTNVGPGMPAYDEELFGPVACIIRVPSEARALEVANDTAYGLGAAVFTQDLERGERIARTGIEAGSCFVNDFVKSDPRMPFGGVKMSGFGRELSHYGIREFVNVKTVSVEA